MRANRKGRAAEVLLTIATLLLSTLLIRQCADMYLTGTAPVNRTETGVLIEPVFSREAVAGRLAEIAWAFVLWGMALAAAVTDRMRRPVSGAEHVVLGVHEWLTLARRWCEPTENMRREERKRRMADGICVGFCLVCAAGAGEYLASPAVYAEQDMERAMGRLLIHVIPWTAAALAADVVRRMYADRSERRELERAQSAPKRRPTESTAQTDRFAAGVRLALYAAAAGLILAGALNGGMRDVLVKAINICTECIGLG